MNELLIYSTYLVLLINLIVYSYSFFRKGKANVFFVSYLAFGFAMQFSMELCYQLGMTNLIFVNIYFIGQMIILGLFYNSLTHIKSQKRFIKISLVTALLVLAVQFCIDSTEFLKFNLFEITLTSLLIVIFALFHFYNMLTESKRYYYTTVGLIFYLLASTVLYLIGNFSAGLSNELKYLTWILNTFLILIYQFFILYDWKINFYKEITTKN